MIAFFSFNTGFVKYNKHFYMHTLIKLSEAEPDMSKMFRCSDFSLFHHWYTFGMSQHIGGINGKNPFLPQAF